MALDTTYLDSYNKELIFDLTLQAFSVFAIESSSSLPRVHAYMPVPNYYLAAETVTVVDSAGVPVTDSTGAIVTTTGYASNTRTSDARKFNFKFLTTYNNKWTFSEYRDYTFYDWVDSDGTGSSFSSYLLTGYNVAGDMARRKRVIYLQVFCKRTEEYYTTDGTGVILANQSSCMVKSEWEWHDSADQGKWGTSFQAYRFLLPQPASPVSGDTFAYGASVIQTKNKLRGSGEALSLLFESTAGKDMKLLGWNALVTVQGEP